MPRWPKNAKTLKLQKEKRHFRRVLEIRGAVLRALGGLLAGLGGVLEASWRRLGGVLGAPGSVSKARLSEDSTKMAQERENIEIPKEK